MRNIVIVSAVPISETIISNRLLPFFSELQKKNFTISLVCPESVGNNRNLPEFVKLHEVEVDATRIKSFVKRAVKEAASVISLLQKAREVKSNVYLLMMPSMFFAFLSPWYLRKQHVFLDIRDLTWQYLSSKSLLQRLSKQIFAAWFSLSIGFFKGVSVSNETELLYLKALRQRKNSSPPLLVSNGISKKQFDMLQGLQKAEQHNVVYIGNVGLAQNLETLVSAASCLPHVRFQVVGAGVDLERVQEVAAKKQADNVEFVGRVNWERVSDYYNNAHILYAQLTQDYASAMPSKLYEYLATGKYIIYGGQEQAANILTGFEHNAVIPPENEQALVQAINAALADEKSFEICAENQQKIEKLFIREDAAQLLVAEIERSLALG